MIKICDECKSKFETNRKNQKVCGAVCQKKVRARRCLEWKRAHNYESVGTKELWCSDVYNKYLFIALRRAER